MNQSLIDSNVVTDIYLTTKTSAKSGKEYTALIIALSTGYEKMLFLEPAELFMVQELLKQSGK